MGAGNSICPGHSAGRSDGTGDELAAVHAHGDWQLNARHAVVPSRRLADNNVLSFTFFPGII